MDCLMRQMAGFQWFGKLIYAWFYGYDAIHFTFHILQIVVGVRWISSQAK